MRMVNGIGNYGHFQIWFPCTSKYFYSILMSKIIKGFRHPSVPACPWCLLRSFDCGCIMAARAQNSRPYRCSQ